MSEQDTSPLRRRAGDVDPHELPWKGRTRPQRRVVAFPLTPWSASGQTLFEKNFGKSTRFLSGLAGARR
jgi:hypothetical protein